MYTLLIDTHSQKLVIVLYKENKVINKIIEKDINNHSSRTINAIKEALASYIKPNELSTIVVVNGPGSFTGLRIGVTIAKTMAYLLNIPIKVIDYLYLQALVIKGDSIITSVADPKGYYIGQFISKKVVGDYKYVKKELLNEYIKKTQAIFYDELKDIDYNSLIDEIAKLENVNVHQVKPLYVKKIEVENGKKSN